MTLAVSPYHLVSAIHLLPPPIGLRRRGFVCVGFAFGRLDAYIRRMPLKPIELPPTVARRFVEDMRAFHAEPNAIKRDEIAARQLHTLKQHYRGKLRLFDVKEMFEQLRDQV